LAAAVAEAAVIVPLGQAVVVVAETLWELQTLLQFI
jgi:hypothetical protein